MEPEMSDLSTQGREPTALEIERIGNSQCRVCGSANGSFHHPRCALMLQYRARGTGDGASITITSGAAGDGASESILASVE